MTKNVTHVDISRTNTNLQNLVYAQIASRTAFLDNLTNKVLDAIIKTYVSLVITGAFQHDSCMLVYKVLKFQNN